MPTTGAEAPGFQNGTVDVETHRHTTTKETAMLLHSSLLVQARSCHKPFTSNKEFTVARKVLFDGQIQVWLPPSFHMSGDVLLPSFPLLLHGSFEHQIAGACAGSFGVKQSSCSGSQALLTPVCKCLDESGFVSICSLPVVKPILCKSMVFV